MVKSVAECNLPIVGEQIAYICISKMDSNHVKDTQNLDTLLFSFSLLTNSRASALIWFVY